MHKLHVQARMNRLAAEFSDLVKIIEQYKNENSESEFNALLKELSEDYPFNETLEETLKKVKEWNKNFQN